MTPRSLLWNVPLALAALAAPALAQQTPKEQPKPCAGTEYRQFDFWLGEWEVRSPEGKLLGKSRVEQIAGPCALLENWHGAGGGSGKSINFYMPDDGKWHQTWAGSGGSFLFLTGGLEGGKMVLSGTTHAKDGAAQLERISWTPADDGSVEQRWEQSTDGGKSWKVAFVGIYRHPA